MGKAGFPEGDKGASRVAIRAVAVGLLILITLSMHYSLLPFPHWVHLVHRRLCYVPIILASLWFGLPGGVASAAAISLAVLPLALSFEAPPWENEELVEIAFYLGIGTLAGFLVSRRESERTRKEELERELARAERLAAMGRTAAGIAHEVRTPLGSIQGAAEILAEDFPEVHPRRPFFDILAEETRRLARVMEDFLDLSRPIQLRPAPVSLRDVAEAAASAVSDLAASKGVRIELSVAQLPPLQADSDRLRQTLVNLLRNAIQISPEGGAVRLAAQEDGAGITMSVEDEGPGIPPGEEESIFEPFFTRRPEGTGLGLSLARQIAAAHGGELKAQNRAEGGARLLLRLPRS